MSLIAKVMVVVLVDGERTGFMPGDEIPKGVLSAHDERELKASGSVEDTAETEKATKAAGNAEKVAGMEFQAAKKKVQGAKASVQVPDTPPAE